MDNTKFMHMLQAIRDTSQLGRILVRLLWGHATTYKLSAVYMPVPLDELVDVSVFHPLGNHCKPVFIHCHPKQW